MATKITSVTCTSLTAIDGTDCIGDTRPIINNNFTNLGTGLCTLSSYANSILPITNAKLAFDGGSLGFRNKIINGNFDIWQRGTTQTASVAGSYFVADRFSWNPQGNTITTSRQQFTTGQTSVPNEPTYFHRMQVTASAATQPSLEQCIESVTTLANKQATLTFWAKGASNFNLTCSVSQNFGTGGSPSSSVTNVISTVSLTTSWQKFTLTFSVPSISGKTIGSDNNDNLKIVWQMPANSNNTFDIAQVQLEEGPTATSFEQRPISLELSLCQRYFETNYTDIVPGTPSVGSDIHTNGIPNVGQFKYNFAVGFKVTKRTSPTVTLYSPKTGAAGKFALGTWPNTIDLDIVASSNQTGFHTSSVFTATQYSDAYVRYTAAAEL